jgi:hypothetical protein
LPPGDVTQWAGIPVTTPARTGFDLGRLLPRIDAVIAVDALLSTRFLNVGELQRFALSRPRWRGAQRLPKLFPLLDSNAESPMESRVRLILIDAGLPRPVAQYVVFDESGTFVARLDLAYPERKVGIEYEGDHHRSRGAFQRDLQRLNALRALGWTILRFGPDDVLRHPGRIAAQVAAILGE